MQTVHGRVVEFQIATMLQTDSRETRENRGCARRCEGEIPVVDRRGIAREITNLLVEIEIEWSAGKAKLVFDPTLVKIVDEEVRCRGDE